MSMLLPEQVCSLITISLTNQCRVFHARAPLITQVQALMSAALDNSIVITFNKRTSGVQCKATIAKLLAIGISYHNKASMTHQLMLALFCQMCCAEQYVASMQNSHIKETCRG